MTPPAPTIAPQQSRDRRSATAVQGGTPGASSGATDDHYGVGRAGGRLDTLATITDTTYRVQSCVESDAVAAPVSSTPPDRLQGATRGGVG